MTRYTETELNAMDRSQVRATADQLFQVDGRSSKATMIESILTHYERSDSANRRAAEQKAENERRVAEYKERADRRAMNPDLDFRSIPCDKDEERAHYAMRTAKSAVDGWADKIASHQAKLAESPVYALGWSGTFMEAAAEYEIAKSLLDAWFAGASVADMTDECLKNTLWFAKEGSSRSTSAMANLMDDMQRQAWARFYEKLSGRGMF